MIGRARGAFVNYVADPTRASPINRAVARVLLGAFLLWKVLSLEWAATAEWPFVIDDAYAAFDHELLWTLLPYQQWLLAGLLIVFIVGYRTKWVGLASALLLAEMALMRSLIYYSGQVETLFIASYFLLVLSLFPEPDRLSVDGFRETRTRSIHELNAFLKGDDRREYRMTGLAISLVIVSIVYVGAAWGKVLVSGLEWITAENLGRYILYYREIGGVSHPAGEFVVQYPELLFAGVWGTILFEVALLPAALLKRDITAVAAGLIGLHLAIIAMLGLYFLGNVVFLLMFVAWDRLYAAIARDSAERVDLVYDERCYFCARSLYPFKLLDINRSVDFYTQSDAPEEYAETEGVDYEERMYLFRDGEPYGGYEAFRQLIRQFRVFAPVALLMALPPVRAVGERLYGYVADNRSRYFVCSVEDAD